MTDRIMCLAESAWSVAFGVYIGVLIGVALGLSLSVWLSRKGAGKRGCNP